MEPLVWALIVVTASANVSFSTGYPSKALCEEAISIAKTGMTVMELKSEQERAHLARQREQQEWEAKNPGKDYRDGDYRDRNMYGFVVSTYDQFKEIKYAKCVLVDQKDK